ncbi:apolipoprotein N-acyltransferase [Salinibacterium hongtaonis]|uniref:Apolipoprotein N-acyltransferase n=1 Tax=Homoserinimonas hongtaonis TaxID=2079791 RepID=A0A2U1SYH0_9MICO|nr:apolipoprotein N-acyltransferase [Salinibacterium hongtaonis]PWB96593.1 apolipoprotein N-acyltransferase [Salinibacterium hongtaonis]
MAASTTIESGALGLSARRRGAGWLVLRVVVAVLGGALLAAAFPPLGWWPLAVVGTALILASLRSASIGAALVIGLLGGFAFYGLHVMWLTTYLGPVPWLALAGLESVFFAGGAVLIALAWRWVTPLVDHAAWRMLAVPALVGGVWVAREAVASVWPYGGFSWGRLAFSQSESPLGELVAWVGSSGLSWIVAFLAAMLVQAVAERSLRPLPRFAPVAVALVAAIGFPAFPIASDSTVRVGAVQGNADAGLYTDRQRGDILDDHLQASLPILDEEIDVMVWPENAADLNPLRYPQAAGVLDFVTERTGAPLVVGTITDGEEDETFNSLLLWEPGEGAVAQYDKMHPVPFAEYLPDRQFWYPLAPDLFDLIPRDYSIGTRPNVFDIETAQTSILAGLAICFDIVDDALIHQMVDDGAEIILAPTNNADFGRSSESIQQLAIARIRAIEYGRSVVNISTVGVSAIISPEGSTLAELTPFEAGAMVEDVPLSTAITPASVAGKPIEITVAALGLLSIVIGAVVARRRASRFGDQR